MHDQSRRKGPRTPGWGDKNGAPKFDQVPLLRLIETPELNSTRIDLYLFSFSIHIYLMRQRNVSSHDPQLPKANHCEMHCE